MSNLTKKLNQIAGYLAWNSFSSIFNNDESYIISKEGLEILSDEKQLTEISKLIENSKKSENAASSELIVLKSEEIPA
ncbi:hypothetical protein [Tenacibaculum agarivorans]|uniref:hypothetical protein n=1 Tax=Tenacibaculum agarivorans TaxID=1908389 RepID=UPI00094B92EE|nr:hypothetical protein [Tenacibaculum agarivorans]